MWCWIRSVGSARGAIALGLAVSLAQAAWAEEQPQPQDAKVIFAEAQKAYEVGDFQTALDRFSAVYALSPYPELLFNIAQSHRHLGNFERAAFFYRRYLTSGRAKANASLARKLLTEVERAAELEREKSVQMARAEAARAEAALRERSAPAPDSQPSDVKKDAAKELLKMPPPDEPSKAVPTKSDPLKPESKKEPGAAEGGSVLGRWWFWAAVGGVVAAGATTYAVTSSGPPSTTLGEVRF